MNKYEKLFLAWMEEQKARTVEPTLEELEQRVVDMAVSTVSVKKTVFRIPTKK